MESIDYLKGDKLDDSNCELIDKIFKIYSNSVKNALNSNKIVREYGYEVFEEEWKNFHKNSLRNTINDIISRPYLLIPFNLEDVVEGNLNYYQRLSKCAKNSN